MLVLGPKLSLISPPERLHTIRYGTPLAVAMLGLLVCRCLYVVFVKVHRLTSTHTPCTHTQSHPQCAPFTHTHTHAHAHTHTRTHTHTHKQNTMRPDKLLDLLVVATEFEVRTLLHPRTHAPTPTHPSNTRVARPYNSHIHTNTPTHTHTPATATHTHTHTHTNTNIHTHLYTQRFRFWVLLDHC